MGKLVKCACWVPWQVLIVENSCLQQHLYESFISYPSDEVGGAGNVLGRASQWKLKEVFQQLPDFQHFNSLHEKLFQLEALRATGISHSVAQTDFW